jgi:hypothetical protein
MQGAGILCEGPANARLAARRSQIDSVQYQTMTYHVGVINVEDMTLQDLPCCKLALQVQSLPGIELMSSLSLQDIFLQKKKVKNDMQ